MSQRDYSPYERTQLLRHQIDPASVRDDPRPVEYITGVVPFLGREFIVTSDTLIPRVETESLAQRLVAHINALDTSAISIADVGTGCGAIGLTLGWEATKKGKQVDLWLSDISSAAVEIAKQNIQKLSSEEPSYIPDHISIFVSDLLSSYASDVQFDLMVANLPYIPSERIAYLDSSVIDHEPHLALDGGPEGLTLIHAFLDQAIPRLKESGEIWLEVDYTHSVDEVAGPWITAQLSAEMILDEFSRNRFIYIYHQA